MNYFRPILTTKAYSKYMTPIKNVYFIKWSPKERTDIHNHNNKQCDFIILNGPLHECRFKTDRIVSLFQSQLLRPFQVYSINDKEGYHQLYNFDDKIKYSLHRYK
jgi:hypothetical protein